MDRELVVILDFFFLHITMSHYPGIKAAFYVVGLTETAIASPRLLYALVSGFTRFLPVPVRIPVKPDVIRRFPNYRPIDGVFGPSFFHTSRPGWCTFLLGAREALPERDQRAESFPRLSSR